MDSCIFCKIVSGEISSAKVFEDDTVVAFRDVNPAAPTHVLVIPREHVERVTGLSADSAALLGHLLLVGAKVAAVEGIDASGYRMLLNQGPDAGQLVDHLHLHVLGGHRLKGLG